MLGKLHARETIMLHGGNSLRGEMKIRGEEKTAEVNKENEIRYNQDILKESIGLGNFLCQN